MDIIVLSSVVTLSILLISGVSSPKLRAAIYSLPIPITVLLFGTGGNVNTTHLTGLIDTTIFIIAVWFLTKRLSVHIIPSLIIGIILYILLGLAFRPLLHVPFLIGYGVLTGLWLLYMLSPLRIDVTHYKKVAINLRPKDYFARAFVTFGLASIIISIKSLILGAAITFPFNGIFTVYVMRNQLPVLITEILRNFFAIANFFLVVWALQPVIGLTSSIIIGWIVNVVILYGIFNFLPRPHERRIK